MITRAEYQRHYYWMQQAIALAKIAGESGEIPVSAIIVDGHNHLLAQSGNRKEKQKIPPPMLKCLRFGPPASSAKIGISRTVLSMSPSSPAQCAPEQLSIAV